MAEKTQSREYDGGVMKPCHLIYLSLVLSILMGCVTFSARHPEFTSGNVFDLLPGMTQKEIEDRFGSPDRIEKMTIGAKTQDPCPSLIYYYDMRKDRIGNYKHIAYTNTFYFVMDVQPPLLRSWELELIYP